MFFQMLPRSLSMTQFWEMVENKEEQSKIHREKEGEKARG